MNELIVYDDITEMPVTNLSNGSLTRKERLIMAVPKCWQQMIGYIKHNTYNTWCHNRNDEYKNFYK